MQKFICVHGHFYQPPRENPWLEAVEIQESAYPYHDWNERVAAECYAPNAFARLLDGEGRIERIVNNYSKISFNFGPTLLAWMKERAPDVHDAIVAADGKSRERFSGHGSALAQCYNHLIMPLASRRDKVTQVLWGLRDFESRFGRKPEGMWLPECAADNESLDVLAELGLKFTILSPYQASRVRPLDGGDWQDVNGGRIDPTRPYRVRTSKERTLVVFFYDGPVSRAVAFERLLENGGRFAERLLHACGQHNGGDALGHIATDGESYGHHLPHGEMALAYALRHIEANKLARLTNYGEFLAAHPPEHEAEIHQPSAWSCPHGVERWRSDCGCNSGGHHGWNQRWRGPLREALDWLRDRMAPLYEEHAGKFFHDPWAARDHYIDVILNREPENVSEFMQRHAARALTGDEEITALRLLEMQRHALLMYTSCGWFFDEISGLESVQVIQYAARAIQLAADMLATDLEPGFVEILGRADSNIPEHRNGRMVYERFARPAVMDREEVGAHYAVSSLFTSYPHKARIFSYTIEQEDRQLFTSGGARLAVGRVKVTFEITRNSDVITYGVLHSGEQHINCGVRHYQGPDAYATLLREMREAFERSDFTQIIRLMDRHFGESHYSLKNLFRDEQHRILDQILAATREDLRHTLRRLTDRYTPLLRMLTDLGAHTPSALGMAAEYVLNDELNRQFESAKPSAEQVRSLLEETRRARVHLHTDVLAYAAKAHLDRLCDAARQNPEDADLLQRFADDAELVSSLPMGVNLWKPQNTCFILRTTVLPGMRGRAAEGDDAAWRWIEQFARLRERLGFAPLPPD